MQPRTEPMQLEVRFGLRREPAGIAHDSHDAQEDMRSARRTLAELVAAGLFTLRAETACTLEFHFQSVEDWTEFVERPRAGAVEADQRLLDRALSALARGEGAIVASRDTSFSLHACGPACRPLAGADRSG